MTMTQRRTKWKAGLIIAVAVIFLVTLLAVSLSLARGQAANAEATEFGTREYGDPVGPGAASGFVNLSASAMEAFKPGSDGLITNNNHLLYVFFCPNATGEYTLAKNFMIADHTWATRAPTLRGTLNGAGFEIWNAASSGTNC